MFVITTTNNNYLTRSLQTTASIEEAAQFNTKVSARLLSSYVHDQPLKIVKVSQ